VAPATFAISNDKGAGAGREGSISLNTGAGSVQDSGVSGI